MHVLNAHWSRKGYFIMLWTFVQEMRCITAPIWVMRNQIYRAWYRPKLNSHIYMWIGWLSTPEPTVNPNLFVMFCFEFHPVPWGWFQFSSSTMRVISIFHCAHFAWRWHTHFVSIFQSKSYLVVIEGLNRQGAPPFRLFTLNMAPLRHWTD